MNFFKKTGFHRSFFCFLILSIFFSRCGKDDENITYNLICGKWTVSEIQFELTVEGQDLDVFLMNEYGLTEEEAQEIYEANKEAYRESWTGTMEFLSDGNYEFNVGGENYKNYWYLTDDEKTIQVFFIDHYLDFDILSLSENQMDLLFDQIYYSDIVGDNKKEAIAYSNHFTLLK
jgi:hypothetical protein